MAFKGVTYFLNVNQKSWIPQLMTVRYRYWKDQQGKGPLISRYGYDDNKLPRGLLPRIKDAGRIRPMPIYKPKDVFNDIRAMFGQNDYIDILGDNNLHPTRVLYHLPPWIIGHQGNEYQMLLKKRKAVLNGELVRPWPTKWKQMNDRIDYLYSYLNRKQRTGHTTKYA